MILPPELLKEMEAVDVEALRLNALYARCCDRFEQAQHREDLLAIGRWNRRLYKMQAIMARQQTLVQEIYERVERYQVEAAQKAAFEWKPSKPSEPLVN